MTDRELLELLVGEVLALRAEFDRQSPAPTISRKDHRRLAQLLPAVYGAWRDEEFVAADLLVAPTLRPLCGTASAKALGKYFVRVQHVWINGLRIQHVDEKRGTKRWRVERSSLARLSGLLTAHTAA